MVTQQQINEAMPLITAFVGGQDIDPAILRSSVFVLHTYAYEQQQAAIQLRQMADEVQRQLLELRPELQNLVDDEAKYRKGYEEVSRLFSNMTDLYLGAEKRCKEVEEIRQQQFAMTKEVIANNDLLNNKLAELQKDMTTLLKDQSADEAEIRTECKRVFSDEHVDGDSHSVPNTVTLVRWLVNALILRREANNLARAFERVK